MLVLGIESSCDETGFALYCAERGLIANTLHSQINTHQRFGGVVPELASREHIQYLIPLLDKTLAEAKCKKQDIDAIAYTAGPGLIGALLVGACFAKSLAYGLGIPALGIHHLEAHLLAAKLDDPDLDFPCLTLLVSGGHTQLIESERLGHYHCLGDTLDDAVGEAFDKTAKLMGIPYPGGPTLAKLADGCDKSTLARYGFAFSRPMTKRPGLDFSFSGLKTQALTGWEKSDKTDAAKAALAKAFQDAIVETLQIKCKRALTQTGLKRLVIAGGVGANRALRQTLKAMAADMQCQVYFPTPAFCTDNGAMVAYTGFLRLTALKETDPDLGIQVKARWALDKGLTQNRARLGKSE